MTDVSSGIGRAIAACLLDDGWQVLGSARNEQDAAAAASHVNDALAGKTLDGLVNNAGIATARPLRYVPIDDLERQVDVNVYGVGRTCQAFLPLLGADRKRTGKPSKIVSISSLAGRISVPFMSPYSMSKHAVEAMSDAMRVELLPHGIYVVVVEPGPTKTPIFAKTEGLDFGRYKDTECFWLHLR